MGGVPSTPRGGNLRQEDAEYLIGEFVGNRAYPISSDFWQKLLDLPLTVQWPHDRILHACELFAQNNHHTRHLGKVLIHLVLCLQDSMSSSTSSSASYKKAVNATYISSVFLKYIIENSKSEKFEDLCLSFDEDTKIHATSPMDQSIESFFMRGVLSYIGASDVSPHSCLLHHELLNLMFVAMSTQLRSGPSPGTKDVHPFIDAAMIQESTVVAAVVRRLLLNFIVRPRVPFNGSNYPVFPEGSQPGVLHRVSSAAANFVLLPYYTFNYLVSSSGEGLRSPLADKSLLLLLILIHYRKCVIEDESITNTNVEAIGGNSYMKETYFCENPYCKALNSVRDVEFDRVDIEGNAQSGPVVRLPFASLFDTLGLCLDGESSVLLLYSLVHGNSDFLEYVLVRTDLDTLLMPILETLYNTSKRTPNQIYMLLIVLLILSQDSSFNASIHKLILQSVPWYQERLLHKISLGSLMVVILIRTVKYNLSKLRDVYLHTNCLAILANMAPHVHKLSAYASQRLVSLFDMLSRKYIKLTDIMDDSVLKIAPDQFEGNITKEDMVFLFDLQLFYFKPLESEILLSLLVTLNVFFYLLNNFLQSLELHIYTDFLRIVLEIFNAILTYALPRNPEVVYAIMHRQEVFQPFKNHPRFNELIENIYTVLDFFNSRMDMQQMEGEWSVDKVLQVIITNCRSWRGEGMKMFNQLRFTYEQESHPEEFFIPYVWRLVVLNSFSFNLDAITLFPIDQPVYETQSGELDV